VFYEEQKVLENEENLPQDDFQKKLVACNHTMVACSFRGYEI